MLIELVVDNVLVGVPGALGARADLRGVASDSTLDPTAFVAMTLKSYTCPFTSPDYVNDVVAAPVEPIVEKTLPDPEFQSSV